mgnify:CR=1 FL=1
MICPKNKTLSVSDILKVGIMDSLLMTIARIDKLTDIAFPL